MSIFEIKILTTMPQLKTKQLFTGKKGKQHTLPRMAKRIERVSEIKFKPTSNTDDLITVDFLDNVLEEWAVYADPETGKALKYELIEDGEEIIEGDEPEPVPCVCGSKIRKGVYYKIRNKINGNILKLGSGCFNYIRFKVPKDYEYKRQIKRKLINKANRNSFNNMDDYVRAVVAETIKEWDFTRSLKYLSIYQENDVIRGLLIENCEKKSKKAFTIMTDDIEKQKKYKNNYKKEVIELQEELAIVKAELETMKKQNRYDSKKKEKEKLYKNLIQSYDSDSSDEEETALKLLEQNNQIQYLHGHNNIEYVILEGSPIIRTQDKLDVVVGEYVIRKGMVSYPNEPGYDKGRSNSKHYIVLDEDNYIINDCP